MNIDHRLSEKTYYETLLGDIKKGTPIEVLGEMFLEEHKKELSDLSYIRFAQGEVYYHFQDYEAAIFKWENISNELEAWAKKNVGDAYFELNLLSAAIEKYTSIKTEHLILQTEIALKLFQIYLEENQLDLATQYIKQAVSLNPDYQNLTKIARVFFEQNNDADAVELAVNEGLRTEDVKWFDILIGYVEEGRTKATNPSYFATALEVLYQVDTVRFEKLVTALWKVYKFDEQYIHWINVLNELLYKVDVAKSTSWNSISSLYKESFKDFLAGRFELKEMIGFIPVFLENWTKIAKPSEALWAYSALLTWDEYYPSSVREEAIETVKSQIVLCKKNRNLLQESFQLFQSITQWAASHDVEIGAKLRWFVQEILDLSKRNVLLVGVNGTGKSSFINTLLDEPLFEHPTTNAVRIKNGNVPQVTVITEQNMYSETVVPDIVQLVNHDLTDVTTRDITDISIPSEVLDKYEMTFIDTPGFRARREELEISEYLPLADELLFVLDAEDPFTVQERDILLQILQHEPHLPITFIVTKLDNIYNKQEAKKIVQEVKEKIEEYLPNANVIPFSSKYEVEGQHQAIQELFESYKVNEHFEEKRTDKLLHVIQRVIAFLLKNRVEKENAYRDEITWNEDMVNKLEDAIQDVQKHEDKQVSAICDKYHSIKKGLMEEMELRIPQLLRDCGDLLKEDSDFRKVHLELNEEMNKRIHAYVEEKILPRIYTSMQEWIVSSTNELNNSKEFLDEISHTFNELYGEEVVNLQGDFRILEDWERDMSRLTSVAKLEPENILLRHTPSQFILKSAGKILGSIIQNKTLYNQYKKFIENEDYTETTNSVIKKIFGQYELFEQGIERDLALFFKQPIKDLKDKVQEAHENIKEKEELLDIMKTQPELYYDAVTLFKIRQRQYEWMNDFSH
ncbi:MAG: GTP-binding protein [Bacillus sp. (in: firmicutes)]